MSSLLPEAEGLTAMRKYFTSGFKNSKILSGGSHIKAQLEAEQMIQALKQSGLSYQTLATEYQGSDRWRERRREWLNKMKNSDSGKYSPVALLLSLEDFFRVHFKEAIYEENVYSETESHLVEARDAEQNRVDEIEARTIFFKVSSPIRNEDWTHQFPGVSYVYSSHNSMVKVIFDTVSFALLAEGRAKDHTWFREHNVQLVDKTRFSNVFGWLDSPMRLNELMLLNAPYSQDNRAKIKRLFPKANDFYPLNRGRECVIVKFNSNKDAMDAFWSWDKGMAANSMACVFNRERQQPRSGDAWRKRIYDGQTGSRNAACDSLNRHNRF